jgi:hypothetical protein
MKMENELKPCPFCGGKSVCVATSTVSGYIYCSGCDMATNKFWDDPMSEPAENRKKWHEVATSAWNRRCNDGT